MTPTLFDVEKLSHRNDPETSRKAAEKMVKSGELAKQERDVLAAINCCPGSAMASFNFTAKELTKWTFIDIDYYVIQRRLSGLREKGKIRYHIIYPAQCSCGHLFLEKYRFAEPNKKGEIGLCWCGFCRTKLMLKGEKRNGCMVYELVNAKGG